MPKYYRFRAFTPTRKTKRSRDPGREKEKEITKAEPDRDLLESLTLACTHVPSWYLRRTSWRQSSWLLPRQLSDTLRASFQLSNCSCCKRNILYVRDLASELFKL